MCSRGDDFVAVDKLGVRDGFAMALEHMQWVLGVPEVVVVNTVVYPATSHNIRSCKP